MPQSRSSNTTKRVSRVARGKRTEADARGAIEELSAARRDVYRTDVEFTGSEESQRKPYSITTDPDLIKRIGELRALGWSQLAIACEIDASQHAVSRICQRYGFTKKNDK